MRCWFLCEEFKARGVPHERRDIGPVVRAECDLADMSLRALMKAYLAFGEKAPVVQVGEWPGARYLTFPEAVIEFGIGREGKG